jgi:hypothetical protein
MSTQANIIQRLRHKFHLQGFDVIKEFCIGQYNNYYAKHDPKYVLDTTWSNYGDHSLAIIVGNTKRLWSHFVNNYNLKYNNVSNPLDQYVMDSVEQILIHELEHRVYFSHQKSSYDVISRPVIAIQRAAHIARVAFYDDKCSYLCIHKEYGPWFALRCVIVLNTEYEQSHDEKETPLQNPCSTSVQENTKIALQAAIKDSADWKKWVALRDACGVQFSSVYRYGPNQMKYHYTLDKRFIQHDD